MLLHSLQPLFSPVRKISKNDISFILSVRPSLLNNSTPTGRIFIKFYIWLFLKIFLVIVQLDAQIIFNVFIYL